MSKRKNLRSELKKSPRQRHWESQGRDLFDDSWRGDPRYQSGIEKTYGGYTPRCYEHHSPLPMPGKDFVVYGGNCSTPVVTDADIYVGLCTSMKHTARSWPWKVGTEFLFSINDMQAPSNPAEFKKLIKWLKSQIDGGKKVHVGCIGGHGRTGTVLAALVAEYGELDAINYVRKHYCKKAVESSAQINFLHENFGVTKVTPSKGGGSWCASAQTPGLKRRLTGNPEKASYVTPSVERAVHPLAGAGSIWD